VSDIFVDLFGQFPCRGYDQRADTFADTCRQSLQNGKHECGCFSGAGLREAHDILLLENLWNGLKLNRGGHREAEGLNAGFDVRVKVE
jgi:hypothetical protein